MAQPCRADCPLFLIAQMVLIQLNAGRALLAVVVFFLSAAPLELQRRIVNHAIREGAASTIPWLGAAYVGVDVIEQAVKLALNVYRAWVS